MAAPDFTRGELAEIDAGVRVAPKYIASTFRIPGRAGTSGQHIMSIHNATGSTKTVRVKKIHVNNTCTVVKAVTVLPPVVRAYKVTVLPLGDCVTISR